jgi:CHAT domain-containing protein
LLAFLPLHAAGRHDTRLSKAPCTVLDRVVSSYTPTIRALLHSRRARSSAVARTREPHDVVVVAMSHTPGASDLPGAAAEASMLRDLAPGRVMVLDEQQATWQTVTNALPRYPWAHFACHGQSEPGEPSQSFLLLHDHRQRPLTVLDVTHLSLQNAELAFLSACSTARPGGGLPDEALHLAAAFQLAGYRHVIATLWPIDDRDAVRIAKHVYRAVITTERNNAARLATTIPAAQALHAATRRIRAIQHDQPSTWAAHIHNGA